MELMREIFTVPRSGLGLGRGRSLNQGQEPMFSLCKPAQVGNSEFLRRSRISLVRGEV